MSADATRRWLLLHVGVGLGAACVAEPDLRGPLPARNQHPAQLTVLHFTPRSTEVLAAGAVRSRTDAAYTSLFLSGTSTSFANSSSWLMDGEYLRVGTRLGVGLGAGLELCAELALAHTTGGFLDDFVIDYHDTFGFPDQGRTEAERDRFDVRAERNGREVWSVSETDAELLDLPLDLTFQVTPPGERQLGVAVQAGIELPTGDAARGFGNGEIDVGAALLLDYRIGGIGLHGSVQHTFAGTPDRYDEAGLEFGDVTAAGLAAELPLFADLSALVQVTWETSALRRLGPRATARDQVLLWVGGRYQPARRWAIEVGFGEDLQGLASPDFTAWAAFVWQPGS